MESPGSDSIVIYSEVFVMIRNLNQQTFRGYGSVSPERPGSSRQPSITLRKQLVLEGKNVPVLRAVSEVWLSSSTGMTVLAVSHDASNFQYYYLDKHVCIHSGVYFCLYPFRQQSAQAGLCAHTAPEETGSLHEGEDFQLSHQLWVTYLYTFFYHEKERASSSPVKRTPCWS